MNKLKEINSLLKCASCDCSQLRFMGLKNNRKTTRIDYECWYCGYAGRIYFMKEPLEAPHGT